jgi:hypothetical protein
MSADELDRSVRSSRLDGSLAGREAVPDPYGQWLLRPKVTLKKSALPIQLFTIQSPTSPRLPHAFRVSINNFEAFASNA